jgi:hypothetical protein
MDIGNKDQCSVCLHGPASWYSDHGDHIYVCDNCDPDDDLDEILKNEELYERKLIVSRETTKGDN